MKSVVDTGSDRIDEALTAFGFDLHQVTWGYQEIFRAAITDLYARGLLGAGNSRVTEAFFRVLQRSDKSTLDSVLKGFLEALTGDYAWIMQLPRLFDRWCETGMLLAAQRHFQGIRFFELAGQGKLGTTPAEVELALDVTRWLLETEPDLAGSFLEGYPFLSRELSAAEMRTYAAEAVTLFARNPQTAKNFLTGALESSRFYVERTSRQATLTRERAKLKRLTRALLGDDMDVENLGELDADELVLRGCAFVACPVAMYLPEKLAEFGDRAQNEACFRALVTLGCMCQAASGFARLHGSGGMRTCLDLVPGEVSRKQGFAALFHLVEVARVLAFCRRHFPGLRPWLQRLREQEFSERPPGNAVDALASALLLPESRRPAGGGVDGEILAELRAVVAASSDCEETVALLHRDYARLEARLPKESECTRVRPFSFFPDPFFPLKIGAAPAGKARIDQGDAARDEDPRVPERPVSSTADNTAPQADGDGMRDKSAADEHAADGLSRSVGYVYDEWNVHCDDYYRDWCCVHECRPRGGGGALPVDPALQQCVAAVRQAFERLKPVDAQVETRLLEGDDIDLDAFVAYVAQREKKSDTDLRFYTKPLIRRRDVAVAVLLDLSGSTGERCRTVTAAHTAAVAGGAGEQTVLAVEKQAAFVLGSGLDALGDRFAVYGFTGTGRSDCRFSVIKDFAEPWDEAAVQALMGTVPGSATRIGVAVRHAGYKLKQQASKTKLLLLITDGKPCDQAYDTASGYAQHDVRRACRENMVDGIHTFCVSTPENTPADLELMFPRGRYLVMADITRLPTALSDLYLRLAR